MDVSEGAARVLAGLLEARTGQQLGPGRLWRIDAALRPLAERHGAASLDDLVHRIVSGAPSQLADEAIEALLNHETFFFRDMAVFRLLDEEGLARMQAARAASRRLRIWSAGCSTGQEAYTAAMLIAGRPDRWQGWTIEILGTDLSPVAIERARQGRYPQREIQRGLPIQQMMRWFRQEGDDWQVTENLRSAVRWRVHNLMALPPAGEFDVVLCRNVMLYFAPEVRARVFDRIAGALAPDGVLMLGAGETTLGQTEAFMPDVAAPGLYRRRIAPPQASAARSAHG